MSKFFKALIILDTSPVLVAQDCRVITKWVDGLVLVVAAGKTPAKLVEEALNRMESKKIVGFVFNDDARSLTRYDSHGYDPERPERRQRTRSRLATAFLPSRQPGVPEARQNLTAAQRR